MKAGTISIAKPSSADIYRLMQGVAERFWAKVAIGGPGECWEWQASTLSGSYGQFGIPNARRNELSHRVALMLSQGAPIPDGLVVRHRCDNPGCCNPGHLVAGTQSQNMADAVERGRVRYVAMPQPGERNGRAKLKLQDVAAIRASTDSYAEIMRRYGISNSHVWRLRAGIQWREVEA